MSQVDEPVVQIREERRVGSLDDSVARNLDRYFAPDEPKEVYAMGRVHHEVPALGAVCQMHEDLNWQLMGIIPEWGVPLLPQPQMARRTIHEAFQMTRSIQGLGVDQATEVLTPGVTRLPVMSMPYGMEQYGEEEEKKDKKESKWL